MKILIALVALAMTAVNATAHTIDDDFAATPRKDQLRRPGFPMLAVERGLRPPTRAELRLLNAASPRTALPYDCSVEFSDFDALNMIPEQPMRSRARPGDFRTAAAHSSTTPWCDRCNTATST